MMITNKGKNQVVINLTDEELRSINWTYKIIKRNGSKLDSKESMMKLIVLEKTRLCDVLFGLDKLKSYIKKEQKSS